MEKLEKILESNFLENYRQSAVKIFFDNLVTKKLKGDPNKQDYFGLTPLHHAALTNSVELARLLIEAGADVNTLDKYGRTALEVSEERDHTEVATYLKKQKNNNGKKT